MNSGEGITIYNGSAWASGYTLVPTSALATNATNTTVVEAGPTTTATISSSGTPRNDGHEATKVGVGVGLGVGVPLFAALATLWVLLAKEKRKTRLLQDKGAGGFSNGYGYPNNDAGRGQEPQW